MIVYKAGEKSFLNKILKIKRDCIDIYDEIEEAYKQSYELASRLEKEGSIDDTYRSFIADIKSGIYEKFGYYKIRQIVKENTLYDSDEIALTVKDLIKMKGNARVLIGPMIYNESIPKYCLKNLELICSDADFSELDNSHWIRNIQAILGKTVMCDLTEQINLFFTGDIADLTKVSDFKKLPLYNYGAGDVLVSSLTADLKLKIVNGLIKVYGCDISLGLMNKNLCNNNDIICYLNDNIHGKEQDIIQPSYKVKRNKIK